MEIINIKSNLQRSKAGVGEQGVGNPHPPPLFTGGVNGPPSLLPCPLSPQVPPRLHPCGPLYRRGQWPPTPSPFQAPFPPVSLHGSNLVWLSPPCPVVVSH